MNDLHACNRSHPFILGLLLAASPAWAADPGADGRELYAKFRCASCHGDDARTGLNERVPAIAGLDAGYLQIRTTRMVDDRVHETALADCGEPPLASDIHQIADYLAALPR